MRIGGFILFTRKSDTSLNLVTYHPRSSRTWYWGVSLNRDPMYMMFGRALRRSGQWHDYYRLPFNRVLMVSHQDYHRDAPA